MTVRFIGAAVSAGGRHTGCRLGPAVFRRFYQRSHHDMHWQATVQESQFQPDHQQPIVTSFVKRLSAEVQQVVKKHDFPVVIGGDHSCALGTWDGVAKQCPGPIGLLWIDAHMDAHTPASSPSGNIHGMPVATLLGAQTLDSLSFLSQHRIIAPQYCCLVGVRSYEAPEPELLSRLGVTYFTQQDIEEQGMSSVIEKALKIVNACTNGFGLSIDLDVIDPHDAPGVTVAEPAGLKADDLIRSLNKVRFSSRLRGLEISELNPKFDHGSSTVALVSRLVDTIAH